VSNRENREGTLLRMKNARGFKLVLVCGISAVPMRLIVRQWRESAGQWSQPKSFGPSAFVWLTPQEAKKRAKLIRRATKAAKAQGWPVEATPTVKAPAVKPERALAAAEVLAAVWLSEKHFELEHKIDDPPIAEEDEEGHVWVTVKLHVPALDIDLWSDGTHPDHPNQESDDDDV
jgi:hypothetical protein